MTEELEKAQGLLASGDVPGLLRHLRFHGEQMPLGEVARLVAGAARLAGFDDLAQAATAVAEGGDSPGSQDARSLYDLGYACIERGASYLAVRPLERALELAPDAVPVLTELVAALEGDGQNARAVAVLEEHEPIMQWPHRFLYVYNALMAGDLEKAAEGFGRLPEPEDTAWTPAREKVRRMLARAGTVRAVASLDRQDLRGWHYVLTGGILGSLAPYGFHSMTGRWAYVSDSAGACDGTVGQRPADDRPVEAVADEIIHTTPAQDEGDGDTPPDPDDGLRGFVEAVTAADGRGRDGCWLGGVREHIPNSGPVPSSRFF